MISVIFIAIAGILNAVMDVIRFRHTTSIFNRECNIKIFHIEFHYFFNPFYFSQNKKKKIKIFNFYIERPLQLADAWHFSKMLMIFSFILAVILYKPLFHLWGIVILNKITEIVIYGLAWNIFFNYFFDTVLLTKAKSSKKI